MVGDFQQSNIVSRMCNIRITKLILLSGNDSQSSATIPQTSSATTVNAASVSSAVASTPVLSGSSSTTSSPVVNFSAHTPTTGLPRPPPLSLFAVTNSANSSITETTTTTTTSALSSSSLPSAASANGTATTASSTSAAALFAAACEKSSDSFKFCVGMPKKTLGKAGKVLQTQCFKEGSPYVSGSPSEGMAMDVQFSIRYPHTFKDSSDVLVLELKQYTRKKKIVSSVQIYLSDIVNKSTHNTTPANTTNAPVLFSSKFRWTGTSY